MRRYCLQGAHYLTQLSLGFYSNPTRQGKLLKKLYDSYPSLKNVIPDSVLSKHQINVEDVPSWEYGSENVPYAADLCRDFFRVGVGQVHSLDSLMPEDREQHKAEPMDVNEVLRMVTLVTARHLINVRTGCSRLF